MLRVPNTATKLTRLELAEAGFRAVETPINRPYPVKLFREWLALGEIYRLEVYVGETYTIASRLDWWLGQCTPGTNNWGWVQLPRGPQTKLELNLLLNTLGLPR